jgi:hypothetical protein
MARRVRLKLLGEGWHAFGDVEIPEIPKDRVIEVSEAEAAAFLRHRGSARGVEFLGWVDEQAENAERAETAE